MKDKAHLHRKPSLQEALELIEASSYRLTQPRRHLLEKILAQKKPFSVASLAKSLSKKDGCDTVTIYRTLPVLVELGIIEKCDFADEMTHYEVSLGKGSHHHHHFVCTTCKKIEPLEFCIVEGQEQILKKLGYSNLKHRLEFTGVCPNCS